MGAAERSSFFFAALPLSLVGAEGTNANAIKGITSELAVASGFGSGEFSAYESNLRTLVGAFATSLYSYYYEWCRRSGTYPGSVFMLAAALGSRLPQALLHCVPESELEPGA